MAGRFTAATACSTVVAVSLLALDGAAASPQARWRPLTKLPGIVDVVGPRADGRLVVSTHRGLFLVRRGGGATPYARGAGGYAGAAGEPYIALGTGRRVAGAGCVFARDDVFALDPDSTPGVERIDRRGRVSRFADFPQGGLPSGIAFDTVGRFGYRLLVTVVSDAGTTLHALDCGGRIATIVGGAPRVEGGIALAPRSFGRFAGDLIAPDEHSGRVYAFGPRGGIAIVAVPQLKAGGDIGVESVGFVPPGLGRGVAYMSDLGAPGSPTHGTDSLLVLRGADLARARLATGELVVATEAGARTVAVRCKPGCVVRPVAVGPDATHGEGHITFLPAS
jgi:hypothetical protein